MKNFTKEERIARVIARGEFTDHCHVVTGDAAIKREGETTIIKVGKKGATMRHLIESVFVETGQEVWTKEHKDIPMKEGDYKYVQQINYDPYKKAVEKVRD